MKFQRNKGTRRSIGVSNPAKFVRKEVDRRISRLSMLAIPEDLSVHPPKPSATPKVSKTKQLRKSASANFLKKKFQLKKIKSKIQNKFAKVEVEEIFCPAVCPNDKFEWTRIRSSSELNDFADEDFVAWEEDVSKVKFFGFL
ncbi:Oidioi.mRNA.OKI2018_I69.chr1.g3748.t1.cds [Oikopleura dioica]|uniref:Oidioi.mRNA.OKI2018_I69.chr1.g3748.t1.cds n=1 Tax=Oikopleura dioica TaxID=34765 RepID=A0ABN7SUV6_OIKDI|nr:Oidioi.mRNA.OKI2018_I69.chr1.g3748.t1.cds [Oikopleura dioica]